MKDIIFHLHTKFEVNRKNILEDTRFLIHTVLRHENGTTFPIGPIIKKFFLLFQENETMAINETLVKYVSLWILTKIGKKFRK